MPGRIVQIVKDNKPRGLRMNVWLALVVAILVAIPLICVVVFWGQIREAAMDPATPFQTQEPSPAPDYADPKAWALYPAAGEPDTVDVFFIHPTTHQGRRWNAAFDNKDANRRLKTLMAPNYAGPFGEVGRVFAPHYRQASLYTQITLREDARTCGHGLRNPGVPFRTACAAPARRCRRHGSCRAPSSRSRLPRTHPPGSRE